MPIMFAPSEDSFKCVKILLGRFAAREFEKCRTCRKHHPFNLKCLTQLVARIFHLLRRDKIGLCVSAEIRS